MNRKIKIKRNFKFYTFFLFGAILLTLVFSYQFKNNFSPAKILEKTKIAIDSKDEEINQEIDFLAHTFQNNPDSVFEIVSRYKHLYDRKGYLFFIYDKEQLVFWSDNKAPVGYNNITGNSPVINTGNGWFRKIVAEKDSVVYAGGYLIKRDYSYQNDYLENSFHQSFELDNSFDISLNRDNPNPVYDSNGQFLFSLVLESGSELTTSEINILFILYLFVLIAFIGIIYNLHLTLYRKTGKYFLFIFGFIADLILIRIVIFYFEIPKILYESSLFSPIFYAHSDLIPSIADLLLNAIFLLFISFFVFYHVKFKSHSRKKNSFNKGFTAFTLFLHIFIFYGGIDFVFRSLVIDSSISLDLNNLFNLSLFSFLNILIIAAYILSYVLISSKLSYFSYKIYKKFSFFFLYALLAFLVSAGYCVFLGNCDLWKQLFILFYILSFGFFFSRNEYQFNLGNIVFYIFLFSVISTYSLHKYNTYKEKEQRKLLALHLAKEQRDPVAEYIFQRESDQIYNDKKVIAYLNDYGQESFNFDEFYAYFTNNYFTGYWKKYNCQITICNDEDILILQPEDINVSCHSYFDERILDDGIITDSPELFFLNYSPGENGYMAKLDFSNSLVKSETLKVYIELFPKYVARDLGFPDLLVDKEITKSPDLSSYSYAKYQNNELYKRVGEHFYNFNLAVPETFDSRFVFYNQNGFHHLFYAIDGEKSLIISLKKKSILDVLAPFSYLFLFFIIFFSIIYFIFIYPFSGKISDLNFKTRLQISISSVILFSFIVIGIFTIIYINNLNDEKNKDILSEKTHSVLVEMQHKFSNISRFDEDIHQRLSEMLVKFSSVFFTDINIYGLDGQLISSSRPQIYDEQLVSKNINPVAFKSLSLDNSSLFIHDENIGKQEYLSAYIPFVNSLGDVIGYLNLPYFAQEKDLNREISTFLVAYINIYVILIAISLLIAIIISNYISRPIKMIITKIRQVKLGGQNETIVWNRKDEIGQLVEEYNVMIEQLAKSAELLAKSERESAWREMARQIAHEIKNPLTPMKLNVQYLQRAWQNESPDWEKRLDKFTQTMIEQIDSLSVIASEFSDFSKMPLTSKSNIDLVDIVKSTLSLFKSYDRITFVFDYNPDENYIVFADKEQLLRAFNNLIKNAIQAIGTKQDGKISIVLKKRFTEIMVDISDNGGGISDEISGKIFSPNFTTKSGGMGLGLAIVKNIIINSGGEISYESTKGFGTTFTIKLPAV